MRVQNTRSVQGALMKLARVVKDEDQLVISSMLPWVECGDQMTRACALRAVGRVARFGHREAVAAMMRCIRVPGQRMARGTMVSCRGALAVVSFWVMTW
eukprot:Skav207642  [mRNA]  locus=scaffold1172:319489:323858:+ [translate_table: standard]